MRYYTKCLLKRKYNILIVFIKNKTVARINLLML